MKNEVTRKKLVIVGDGACGKTSLLTTFSRGFFPTEYVPTIFENSVVTVKVDDTLIELELWDTAGQEDFDRLRPFSYANTDVVLIAFSVDNVASLESVQREVRSF
jgi:small GTP-binding protein